MEAPLRILVTAGNTLVPLDRVRGLTNIFTGRTGAGIAMHAHDLGHCVTLLTSHPDTVAQMVPSANWSCHRYRTFDDLHSLLEEQVRSSSYDVVIHSAAVSDYEVAGVYAPAPDTQFEPARNLWQASDSEPGLINRSAGKIKSDEPELWVRLVRAPKLVDRIRIPWGFVGQLVKFKLEVDVSEEELLIRAERSRQHSAADWMVANTLDGASEWAYLGSSTGYIKIARQDLAARLLSALTEVR